MKPGIVFPGPLGSELSDCAQAAEAGAAGIVARPGFFVDESFAYRAEPEAISDAVAGPGLELAALWAAVPVLGEGGDTSAGVEHIRACLGLANALRDFFPPENYPLVICDAGAGSRIELWGALVEAFSALAAEAEGLQAILAVRPDRGTVIDRARSAAKLLGEVGSGFLQVALDAAATVGDKDTLDDAIERLKENIVLAFARDVKFDGEGHAAYVAPGKGLIASVQHVKLLSEASGCAYIVVGELDTAEEAQAALGSIGKLVS